MLELPTVWAASSAETFARGAVDLLALTRSVDVLSFGSECGDVEPLSQIACCLNTPGYETLVRRYVLQKLPFAAARQRAVEELLGPERAALLSTPNNNLGVEYLRNLERDGWAMGAVTVRRAPGGRPPQQPAGRVHSPLRLLLNPRTARNRPRRA